MSLLDVNGIDVYYGAIQALRGVSLSIEAGERVALLGANGAGKTTTLRTISGMVHPAEGSVVFEGEPIHELPPYEVIRRGVAHLPEGRELFPGLTVEENLRYGYWIKRKERSGYKAKLEEMFEIFPRLRERASQASGTMSGGEQQMLAVARALMSSPKLLIVDELSLGLAPIIVEQLFQVLDRVNETGTALLIVEQFVHMALENTDRAYVLARGEVALTGTSTQMRNDPALIASYLGSEASMEIEEPEPAPKKKSAARKTAARTKSR